MADTTRLTLNFDDVAVMRDMARHYLDTTSALDADDDLDRRELMHERAVAADLYEKADRAVKRLAAR